MKLQGVQEITRLRLSFTILTLMYRIYDTFGDMLPTQWQNVPAQCHLLSPCSLLKREDFAWRPTSGSMGTSTVDTPLFTGAFSDQLKSCKTMTLPESHNYANNVPREVVIWPFFFEENGNTVTVNSERYIKMALEPLLTELSRLQTVNMQRVWFQQDGATPHTHRWLSTG